MGCGYSCIKRKIFSGISSRTGRPSSCPRSQVIGKSCVQVPLVSRLANYVAFSAGTLRPSKSVTSCSIWKSAFSAWSARINVLSSTSAIGF